MYQGFDRQVFKQRRFHSFTVYVEKEDVDFKKPKIKLSGDAKEALKDYYDAAHTLCKAQTNFMSSTKVLEEKLNKEAVLLYAELFLGMCYHQSVEVFYESGRVNCVERILD